MTDGRVHEQGAGRRRVPLLVPRHRGVVPDRAARADRGLRARHRPGRAAAEELHPARAVPVRLGHRLRVRLRRLPDGAATWRSTRSATTALREEQTRAREEGRLIGIGIAQLHRGRRRRAAQDTTTSLGIKMFDSAELRVHPTGKAILKLGVKSPGPGPRDDVRADRRRELGIPSAGHQGDGGRHRQHALRARHLRLALDAGRRRGHRDGLAQARATRRGRSPRTCSRRAEDDIELRRGQFFVRARRDRSVTIQDVAFAAYTNLPDGMEPGSRACTTTTRRT